MTVILKRLLALALSFVLLEVGSPAQLSVTESGSPAQLSVMEAADYLYEVYYPQGLPNAQRVDTEDFQGYILIPLHDLGEPGGQQFAFELSYYRTGDSGEYYIFWLHERLVDDPETGLGHCVTSNFFAVSTREGGPILMERTDWTDGLLGNNDPEFDEAGDREMDRRSRFADVVNGEEPLAEDDPLKIN